MIRSLHISFFALLLSISAAVFSQEVIVGYLKVTAKSASDTIVSIPFHQLPAVVTEVTSSTRTGNEIALELALDASTLGGGFQAAGHYLRLSSGPNAGMTFKINEAAGTTVEIPASGLESIAAGTGVEMIPYWTLGNLFSEHRSDAIHESNGKLPVQRKTEILFFDSAGSGIQLAPDKIFFLTATGWFQATAGYPSADDIPIPPGAAFVIRHPAGVADTTLFFDSYVNKGNAVYSFKTDSSERQDVPLGIPRPIPVKLSELNLAGATTFTESASTSEADREDELLVFDNSAAVINKKPSKTYFKTAGQWRLDDGNTFPTAENDEIPAGAGVIVRKAATNDGQPHIWVNTPSY